jgi:Tol biopolymer transport system component
VRALDAEDAQPIAGTEGALQPFWSPDGRSLGFFADGKLKRVALAGGPPRVLASAPTSWGGTWGAGGDIVFSADPLGGLSRVSADGGTPQAFTTLGKGEEAHHWPSFLPDGRHFVFLGDAPTTAGHTLRLGSLDSGSSVEIVHAVSNVSFVPPDLLLFVRAGTLLAQRFDPRSGKARGEPVPLGAPIARLGDQHEYDFGASAGVLAFRTRAPETRLTWIDRTGKRLESVGEPQLYSGFRISPDGRRVVYARRDRDERPENIWVLDLARGSVTRVSSTPDGDFNPAWSPDGSRVYFSSYRGGKQGDVYATPSGGGGPDELVFASPDDKMPVAVTPDGRTLLLETLTQSTKGDVDVVSLPEKKRTPFAATPFDERLGDLSPDGRFVAYSSDESGRHEVYVKPIGGGNRVPVSSDGGKAPLFRPDGKELFYISPAGMLMAAPVTPGPAFEAGPPRPICSAAAWGGYAVSSDGERFLVSLRADESLPATTVVLDWTRLVAPERSE